jgi:hypothetical protein
MQRESVSWYAMISPRPVDRDLIYDVLLNRTEGLPSFEIRGSIDHYVFDLPQGAELHLELEAATGSNARPAALTQHWQNILRKPIAEVWLISFPDRAEQAAVPLMSHLAAQLLPKNPGGILWDLQHNVLVWKAKRNYLPRFTVKTALVVAAIVALPLVRAGIQGVGRNAGNVAPPAQPGASGAAQPDASGAAQASAPQRGTLTIRPDHDYLLAIGVPYPVGTVGGADEGHLKGTSDGVDVVDAYALPLPRGAAGSYQSCLALGWTGNHVWGVGYVIPWAQLTPGRQFCVQTTYSGLWISLLTVESAPVGEEVTFSVATWACNARPYESAIC